MFWCTNYMESASSMGTASATPQSLPATKHMRVRETLRRQILEGAIAPGTLLPGRFLRIGMLLHLYAGFSITIKGGSAMRSIMLLIVLPVLALAASTAAA